MCFFFCVCARARAFKRLPMCVNVHAGVRVKRREGEGGREVKMEAEGRSVARRSVFSNAG